MTITLRSVLAALALWLCLAPAAQAQQPLQSEVETIAEIERQVGEIAAIAQTAEAVATDDAKLLQARLAAERASKALIDASVQFRPVVQDINARLETLKAATAEGATPAPEVTEAIKALNDRKALINAALIKAEDGTVAASDVVNRIGQLRRDIFTSALSQRVDLNSVLNAQTLQDLGGEMRDLTRRVSSWTTFTLRFKASGVLWAAGLAILAALGFLIAMRRWVKPLTQSTMEEANPSYLSRVLSAFASTLTASAAFAVFLVCVYLLLDYFALLRPDIAELLLAAMRFAWLVFFVHRLSLAVLAPRHANWRMLPVSDGGARRLHWIAVALAVLTGADGLTNAMSNTLSSPFSLTIALSGTFAIVTGVLLAAVALLRPFSAPEGGQAPWPAPVRVIVLLCGLAPIAAALAGYVGLARFITQQLVVSGALIALMAVGFLAAQALSREHALRGSMLGQQLARRFALTERQLDIAGIGASISTYAIVALAGLPAILMQWGFQPEDIWVTARRFLTELRIGSVTISLTAIAIGIGVFFLGYYLSRRFENWLDQNVLARSRMDRGARASIRTAVGYLGVALAALVGISVAGVQLSNVALVAGALSVGIGFGLQNIVSNFVSGLILLAERPFKEGDWIEAAGVNGIVKKVSVRATEIETFKKQSVILPNSTLINQSVGNWTHRNTLARIDIPLSVSYRADVIKVQEVLRAIADDHPKVLRQPAPIVVFKGFGAEQLEFELRFFIGDLFEQVSVQTEVRFEIVRRFREAGVDTLYLPADAAGDDRPGAQEALAAADGGQPPEPPALEAPAPSAPQQAAPPLRKRAKS